MEAESLRDGDTRAVVEWIPIFDLAVFQHCDLVASLQQELVVVCDDTDSALPVRSLPKGKSNAAHILEIKSAGGFVKENDLHLSRYADCNREALLLTAGKRKGVPIGKMSQPELLQEFFDPIIFHIAAIHCLG